MLFILPKASSVGMLLINHVAFKCVQVWMLSKEGCVDGTPPSPPQHAAGCFHTVWCFGTILGAVINVSPTPSPAWLRGVQMKHIALTEAAGLQCRVNTFHHQNCLKPNCIWDLQKVKRSDSTEPSQILSLQLRLEAERRKSKISFN